MKNKSIIVALIGLALAGAACASKNTNVANTSNTAVTNVNSAVTTNTNTVTNANSHSTGSFSTTPNTKGNTNIQPQ